MSKNAARLTRNKKICDDKPIHAKEKFLTVAREEVDYTQKRALPRFEAKTANQKTALAHLRANKSIVFLTGSAGTGKSMIAAFHAACLLTQKKTEKIFLVRPAVSVGKSIGLLPGTIAEKLEPYFSQTLAHLEKFLGHGYLTYCLEKEIIEMKPTEYLRGMSFESCVVILEEAQNMTADDFKMMLTRFGNDSTLLITADETQNDLRGSSGLNTTLELIERMQDTQPDYLTDGDLNEIDKCVGIVRFTPEDVLRSGITRSFVKMYYHN